MNTNNPKKFTILLVEDNPDDAELAIAAWRESALDLEILSAENGRRALEILCGGNGRILTASLPDLVLLDLNMPVMDGREFLRELKGQKELRHLPVLVLTSSQEQRDVLEAYRLQAGCFLNKPDDFKGFVKLTRAIESFWLHLAVLPRNEAD